MAARFNPPPGWPPAPEGWEPPAGWAPDPSWPAPPPGWQLWVEEGQTPPTPPGAPAPSGEHARFAGPDAGAPTQAFGAPPVPSYADQKAPASFGAPSIPPPGGGWQQGPTGPQGPGGPGAPGAPKSGKQWLIPVIIAVVALAAIFGVLFATGVLGGGDSDKPEKTSKPTASATKSADPTDEPTDDPTDEPTDDPTDEPTKAPTDTPTTSGSNGTRSAPLAPGETATIFTWTVSMGAANLDAWAEIKPTLNEYLVDSYTPEAGMVYVMAPATVTWTGEDRETIYDLDWVFVGAQGTTYEDNCGYVTLPNGLDMGQELYTDATATGNVCITVPADQVDGGVWRVSSYGDFSADYEGYFGLS